MGRARPTACARQHKQQPNYQQFGAKPLKYPRWAPLVCHDLAQKPWQRAWPASPCLRCHNFRAKTWRRPHHPDGIYALMSARRFFFFKWPPWSRVAKVSNLLSSRSTGGAHARPSHDRYFGLSVDTHGQTHAGHQRLNISSGWQRPFSDI